MNRIKAIVAITFLTGALCYVIYEFVLVSIQILRVAFGFV